MPQIGPLDLAQQLLIPIQTKPTRQAAEPTLPELLRGRPREERELWSRWVLGSHSDQFIPEMAAVADQLDQQIRSPTATRL